MDGTRVTERPNDGSTSESPRTPEFFLWGHSGSPNRFDPKVAGGRSGSEHPEPKAWPQRQWWEFLGSYTRCSGLAFTELGGRERCAHHLNKFYRSPLAPQQGFAAPFPYIVLGNEHSSTHRHPLLVLGKLLCRVPSHTPIVVCRRAPHPHPHRCRG